MSRRAATHSVDRTFGKGAAMETMAEPGAVVDVGAVDDDRAWARIGRLAAYVAAIGFLVTTVLYLLDVYDVLDPTPAYAATSAGQVHDEAQFWAAIFAHQHAILWDVIVRDVVGPAAFIALIVVGVALRRLTSGDRPERQLMVTFLGIGGVISAIASLLYLGNAEFWRVPTGIVTTGGQTSMIAVGRATTAINNLTTWPEAFGYLVIALGIACLGALVRHDTRLPRRLGTLALIAAAVLVALAVATAMDADGARSILALAVGAVLAPVLCIWLGMTLGRHGAAA
jgi:hypothetical protein